MSLINKEVEDFAVQAFVNGEFKKITKADIMGKWTVFFFYPADFTFVCPTELHAFQDALPEFDKRNTHVIACSTDTVESHYAWLQRPKAQGGVKGIVFPMVSDTNKTIAARYGVLSGTYYIEDGELKTCHFDADGECQEGGTLVAYRGLFLIDKKGIVQHQVVNNMPLGRSVQETLRMIDALQHFEQYGEVCPIDWHKGSAAMKPDADGSKGIDKIMRFDGRGAVSRRSGSTVPLLICMCRTVKAFRPYGW